jgi:hypothetical protein
MENLPAYVVDWDLSQAERGIESFTQFMQSAGAKFQPTSDLQKMLEAFRGGRESPRYSPREMFEESLMREGNKSLSASGDARRLFREVGEVRRWRLLTPEQVQSARANGVKLEAAGAPFRRAMWTFATIPVAIGTYVAADRLLRQQGVDENLAFLIALAAWFLVRQVLNRTLLRAS